MATTRVMQLWTAVISAFLALFAALGFVSPAAASTPVQQSEDSCNATASAPAAAPPARAAWAFKRSLPPTMKQRIHAEAHGSSPSCRHRPPVDTEHTEEDSELATEALTAQ